MYCLDTDFLAAVLRAEPEALRFAEGLEARNEELGTTPVTIAELFKGAALFGDEEKAEAVEGLLNNLDLLGFDAHAAKLAGTLLAAAKKKGLPLGDFDTVIGAIALRHEATLVTRNLKHFGRIPNLKIVEW